MDKEVKEAKKASPLFTKEQILHSIKYSAYVDYLASALKDDVAYTTEQIDRMIKQFYGKGGK